MHRAEHPERGVEGTIRGTWSRLPQIQVPVLGIAGALDGDDHLRMVRRLAETVPDGRATVIDGAAHYPTMERPEEFNRLVSVFLREWSL